MTSKNNLPIFPPQNDMPPKWGKPPPSTFNLEENIQIVSLTTFSFKNKKGKGNHDEKE